MLPSCSDDGVFIPIPCAPIFAQQDLADVAPHSAAAIWYFPRLFSVPPLNAAITVATGGEEMRDVPISTASDTLNMSRDHSKGKKDKHGPRVTFPGNFLTLWETAFATFWVPFLKL